MIKLLIGGSPCTYWSISQKNGRETEASGMGWELFKNYLLAKQKFAPDFFLYENNKSASQAIKDQISQELGVSLTYINSALVSAQNRQRFYAFNWNVEQPEDRGILLREVLEDADEIPDAVGIGYRGRMDEGKWVKRYESNCQPKANALTTARTDSMVCSPLRVGTLPNKYGEMKDAQATRIYGIDAKSVNLVANGGGQGAKTGLYAYRVCEPNDNTYEVKDGLITIHGKQYPIKLDDGYYIIRKLSVVECCRLQTLPDDYCRVVSNAQAYKCLGNGWTAEVIIHILNGVLKDVPRDEEIVVLSMYDGIGTGRYCLDRMGFTNVKYYAYEIDKYAMQVALSNYPDIIHLGDAFKLRDPNWSIENELSTLVAQ